MKAVLGGSEENPITPIWDFFPSLFKEEKENSEKINLQIQLSKYKTDWIAFAKRHNERRLGK